MYLVFFEDFSVSRVDEISNDDKLMSDDGYLIIVDISDPGDPLEYINGKWEAI